MPKLTYETLKTEFKTAIDAGHKIGYKPEYRFNELNTSIEVGDFYSIFTGSIPETSLLKQYLPDFRKISLSDSRSTSHYLEVSLWEKEGKTLEKTRISGISDEKSKSSKLEKGDSQNSSENKSNILNKTQIELKM